MRDRVDTLERRLDELAARVEVVKEATKSIQIQMDDQPNFDVAVERAIAAANEDREPGESYGELRFVGLTVTLRSHFGRSNHYIYTFEAK